MLKQLFLNLFWDISKAKKTRRDAEQTARMRSTLKEFPAIECENRIKELWKKEERKRFRIVK